jgi:hypothetical protein
MLFSQRKFMAYPKKTITTQLFLNKELNDIGQIGCEHLHETNFPLL